MEFHPNLISVLHSARHIAVLTGAGVSSESGVPTFRDAQADPSALPRSQGRLCGRNMIHTNWRRPRPSSATRITLITQNVDGLHRQAGSENVIELHGNIHRTKCFREGIVIDERPDTGETPPRCPRCGGLLRPDVVWFGEALPRDALNAAINTAQTCDVFFSIGTSSLVQPAASLPCLASEHGAITVEINLDETPPTRDVKYSLRGKAGEVLPELVTAVGTTDSASPPSGGGLFLRADCSRLEDQDTSQMLYNSTL